MIIMVFSAKLIWKQESFSAFYSPIHGKMFPGYIRCLSNCKWVI